MMPLVSPMNDLEFEDGGENNGNNYFPPEGREETSPLVDLGGDGKLVNSHVYLCTNSIILSTSDLKT